MDTTAPVADVANLADVTADCSVDTLTAPTATDNCAGTITGTTTTVLPITAQGTTVVTWTFEDANGNISTQTQNVVINDTTAPVFTDTPSDVTVECDSTTDPSVNELVVSTEIISGSYTVDMADSYGDGWQSFMGTGIEVLIDGVSSYSFTCFGSSTTQVVNIPSGTTSVEWLLYADYYDGERFFNISDPNGNIIYTYQGSGGFSTTQSITTLSFDMPSETIETLVQVGGTGVPVATDNCDSDVTISYVDTIVEGIGNSSVTTRVWTATDDAGNSTTYTQIITVVDTTAPVFTTSPADVTVECDASSEPSATGTAVASDNCDTDVSITYTDSTIASTGNNSVITRVWTATDDNGNSSTYTQTINVVDTTAPVFTNLPESVTVECDADTSPESFNTGGDIISGIYSINMYDSWGDGWQSDGIAVTIDGSVSYVTLSSGSFASEAINIPVGTQSLTWELTQDSYPWEVIFDIIGPSGNIVYSGDGYDVGNLSVASTTPIIEPGIATATDNCDDDVTVTYADTTVAGTGNNSVISRVWTATDDNGNSSTYTQTITVVDTTAPAVSYTQLTLPTKA